MGVDGVVAVAVLENDGQPVGAELPYQADLSRFYRLDRGPHRRRDTDTIPPNDPAARQGVPPELVDDCSLDRPVELSEIRRSNRAGRRRRPSKCAAGELVTPGTLQRRQ